MVIKRSAGQEIQALITELGTDDEVRREAAIARLAVIGTRAVDRLLASLSAPAEATVRVGALRALESIGDPRALGGVLPSLDSPDPDVAVAAVGVMRALLQSRHGDEVYDRLVALALDAARPDAARLAALDVMKDVGTRVLKPVWQRLRDDPSLAVRQRAARETGEADPLSELEAAAAGALPADGAALGALVDKAGASAALPTLHRVLEAVREREAVERSAAARDAWTLARGAIHLALAHRDSRVALYDLRESLEQADGPLPATFVAALGAIGDATALEAVAGAYARAQTEPQPPNAHAEPSAGGDWRSQLADAFRAIADRERIGRRHAVVKRIETKWPEAAPLVSTLSRSRRASSRASRT